MDFSKDGTDSATEWRERNDDKIPTGRSRTQPKWGRIIAIGVVVLALVLGLLSWFVFIPNSIVSNGNRQEQTLSASYSDGANFLSGCARKAATAGNVAKANTDALVKIYTAAIGGRYNQPGSPQVDSGKLFSAVQENYPKTAGIDKIFQQALSIIVGCQDDFQHKQSVILDQVRAFKTWLTGSWWVRHFSAGQLPNENLEINIPGVPQLTGKPALDKMSQPLVTGGTSDAYQNGVIVDQDPFAPATPK